MTDISATEPVRFVKYKDKSLRYWEECEQLTFIVK